MAALGRRHLIGQYPLTNLSFETRQPHERKTTQAAEGLPRLRFTVADIEAMVAAGLMDEDERVELIGGELVPMSPKGNHHEVLKTKLRHEWARRLPKGVLFTPETTFRLSDDTYLEPDFTFYEASVGLKGAERRQRAFGRGYRRFELRLRHRPRRQRFTHPSASASCG